MLEKSITASIQSWLKKQPDVFCWKVLGTSSGIRGLPDICGNVGEKALYLEVKTETGKISPSQSVIHAKIEKSGGQVFVVRHLSEAIKAVESLRDR